MSLFNTSGNAGLCCFEGHNERWDNHSTFQLALVNRPCVIGTSSEHWKGIRTMAALKGTSTSGGKWIAPRTSLANLVDVVVNCPGLHTSAEMRKCALVSLQYEQFFCHKMYFRSYAGTSCVIRNIERKHRLDAHYCCRRNCKGWSIR